VRIEFTSPAKPALITWAGPVLAGTEKGDDPPAPKKAAAKKAPAKKAAGKSAAVTSAAVSAAGVPAAEPAGVSTEGVSPAGVSPAGVSTGPAAAAGPPGSFRYLVVPLRAPARA
jgi:hypothetical protein